MLFAWVPEPLLARPQPSAPSSLPSVSLPSSLVLSLGFACQPQTGSSALLSFRASSQAPWPTEDPQLSPKPLVTPWSSGTCDCRGGKPASSGVHQQLSWQGSRTPIPCLSSLSPEEQPGQVLCPLQSPLPRRNSIC